MLKNIQHTLSSVLPQLKDQVRSQYQFGNVSLHPFTLTFNHPKHEQTFDGYYSHWLTHRVRMALCIVIAIVLIDATIVAVSDNRLAMEGLLDLTIMVMCIGFIKATQTKLFNHYNQAILAILMVIGCIPQISLTLFLSNEQFKLFTGYFYLPTIGCCILGLKYLSSLMVMTVIMSVFNITVLLFGGDKADHLLQYNSIFILYILIASTINYLLEFSKRKEYIYQYILEQDRKKYLKLSQRDHLTGLTNRLGLTRSFAHLVNHSPDTPDNQAKQPLGLLILIDLNQFKPINDQYGHQAGDEVLIDIARRLNTLCASTNNIVARLGGDEFVVFLSGIGTDAEIEHWLTHIQHTISKPISITLDQRNAQVFVSASIGYSIVDTSDPNLTQHLEKADQHMYRNKKKMN